MINVIILNGPPGVGKDTIAEAIKEQSEDKIAHLRFKTALYEEAYALFFNYFYRECGNDENYLSLEDYIGLCSDRIAKDVPQEQLNGMSPRQSLIFTSEAVVKPVLGGDHYGVKASISASQYLDFGRSAVVFSDGGFINELVPMCNRFNVLLVRLHRDGFTFKGDSRSYVESDLPEKVIDIHLEEGNVQFAVDEIMAAAQ